MVLVIVRQGLFLLGLGRVVDGLRRHIVFSGNLSVGINVALKVGDSLGVSLGSGEGIRTRFKQSEELGQGLEILIGLNGLGGDGVQSDGLAGGG